MKLVLDTSVVIALLASDEEQDHIFNLIPGYDYVCAESIVSELGNGRIRLEQGLAMIDGFSSLDIQFVRFNLAQALEISHTYHLYAYDAYVLECSKRLHIKLITLDNRMNEVARNLGISVIEV